MKNLFKKHKIATKFLAWFLLVALLPFCVVGYITYRIYEKSLTEGVLNNLISIADNKANQIENYIIEREKNVASLAHIPAIVDAAKEYEAAFIKKGKMPWRYSPEFIAVDKKFRPFLTYYKETFGFSDLFLISPQGNAVFSVMQGEDLGSNYYTGVYKDTELAKVYDRAKTLLETEVSDFEFYPATNQPAAFLAAPVLKEGLVVGVMVLQMSNEEVYKLAGDYTGLGETGETVIATKTGDKAVFLTPLRHDPNAAFKRRVSIGSKENIPIQEAVQGKKGVGKYIDYRGKEVLAAWRYLPHLRWGMAVEMDTEEVFTPIVKLRSLIVAIGSITIFMVILIALFISRTISAPIVRLTETTRLIAGGDFSKSAIISSKDELGQLAGAYNEMVKKLADRTAEREQAEVALRQSEDKYRSIFENAVEGIFQSTPEGRYLRVNPAHAQIHGYNSPEEFIRSISDIAQQIYVDPNRRTEFLRLLKEQGSVKNFESERYRKDGRKIGVSTNARAVYDESGNVLYYEGTLEDITPRKEAEEKLKETLEMLRKSLAGTIQAMSLTVETRDPYTAGHQRRVADFARAIATEMGLTADQIEGIRTASAIHDIGKISVPAEILSKPTKLSEIEFSLIKVHSQSGYDILKEIDFPWPVARMVLEHHERMNGSGYPQGLPGDKLLIESRIIAVADVVEAMASYRPYRPGLGIDKALDEISKNKGILYDQEVADACLRLFREKRFEFSGQIKR